MTLTRPCAFRKGTALFHPGPGPARLYFIESGCRALVKAIEREPVQAFVPGWPWGLVARAMQWLSLR